MTDKALPLPVRKNIRDNADKLKAALALFEPMIGAPATCEPDWAAVSEGLKGDSTFKERLGDYVTSLVNGLASNFKTHTADVHFKEALKNAWTTKKIELKFGDYTGESGVYQKVTMESGSVTVHPCKDYPSSNLGEAGKKANKTMTLTTGAGLPPALAKSVADHEAKIKAAVDGLSAKGGVTAKFTPNWNEIDAAIAAGDKNFKDRSPEVVQRWLEAILKEVTKAAADDLVKEALQDKWKGEIVIHADAKLSKASDVDFADGKMLVKFNGISNIDEMGKGIEKKL
jgi:hypothetical protein